MRAVTFCTGQKGAKAPPTRSVNSDPSSPTTVLPLLKLCTLSVNLRINAAVRGSVSLYLSQQIFSHDFLCSSTTIMIDTLKVRHRKGSKGNILHRHIYFVTREADIP